MVINKNMRQTSQKLLIREYVESVKTHPSADQVYVEVKKKLPSISLATVYRTLKLLNNQKKIIRISIGKESHFDGNTNPHQHAICSKCGKIIDLFNDKINQYALDNLKIKKFHPTEVSIIYKGYCDKCKE